MSVVKVIEIIAQSKESWEDAARIALREAAKTVKNIQTIYVKDLQAVVEAGDIVQFRANTKISFIVSENR